MLRHVVFFRWKEETSDSDKKAVAKGLEALPAAIPEIRRYELGNDAGLAQGNFDFALIADFESLDDFKVYQAHQDHLRVIQDVIRPVIAARAAVQYWIP